MMNRKSLRDAYEQIQPTQEQKDRMLENILSAASDHVPAGKDVPMKRRKMKPIMIAAIIGLMAMLMGCAIVALNLGDLKIGVTFSRGQILDSDGNVVKESKLAVRDVLSLHGIANTPTYLAHQEWFEFYEEYSENHVITDEENFFIPPEEYEAYRAYNQELMDKIDEIAEKHGLKLLGAFAPFQRWESRIFHEATGVETYLIEDSAATIERESGYFYEGGNFNVEFRMRMPDGENNWPYTMLNTIYFSKSDNFDTVTFGINQMENLEQWNYTTASGAELLVIQPESGRYALIFCVQSDAIVFMRIDTYYVNELGEITLMTKHQLEQVAEQFDYSLKVESVDMVLAKSKLEKYNNSNFLQESSTEYLNFDDFINAKIAELGADASEHYFSLTDINKDGIDDLIVGTEEQIEVVWMMKYGQMNLVMEYGENYKKLKEAWPDMDKKPITEYFDK